MSQSKALSTFTFNLDTLRDLFQFFDARIDAFNKDEMPSIRARGNEASARLTLAGESYPDSASKVYREASELATVVAEHISARNVICLQLRWYAVMLVTITEAYLLDALVEAAASDPSFMENSVQTVAYNDLTRLDSIENLALEMRTRWARNFIDSGGPSCWIDRLHRMGARGYSDGLGETLEEMWGARHLIVHRAGVRNPIFDRRYPGFPCDVNDTIQIDGERVTNYAVAVIEFVGVTDSYLMRRCAAAQRDVADTNLPRR
jgi:hypothetical protein